MAALPTSSGRVRRNVIWSGLDFAALPLGMLVATPILLGIEALILPKAKPMLRAFDELPDKEGHVVIAGFGRVGQIVARVLSAKRIPVTALDIDPEYSQVHVELGWAYYNVWRWRWDERTEEMRARAKAAVQRALELDPVNAAARNLLSYVAVDEAATTELRRSA